MKGNGNGFGTLLKKFIFVILPTSGMRTKYIYKNKKMFHSIGNKCFWQSRHFPADPEYISIGNNVKIASRVVFVNHDICSDVFNAEEKTNRYHLFSGCIMIGNNVMIGTGVTIMPNVRIGNNVIIGAGAIVTKDLPDNSICVGVPAKQVGRYDDLKTKYSQITPMSSQDLWKEFKKNHCN